MENEQNNFNNTMSFCQRYELRTFIQKCVSCYLASWLDLFPALTLSGTH